MEIKRVQRLSIPVSDQDRARDFYVGALGLELIGDRPTPMGENARWLEVAPRGSATSMVLVTWLPAMKPGSVDGLMLEATDVADICERLRRAGISVDGPTETPWGRQATLADPDGNGIVLTEPGPSDA